MTSLFNKLFTEAMFNNISSKSIANGVIDGIVSPYLKSPEDELAITLSDMDKRKLIISNHISKVHNNLALNVKWASAIDMDGFTELRDRLNRTLDANKIFDDDPVIREKLADIFTYCYSLLVKDKPEYKIYSEIAQAKKVTNLIFDRASKKGFNSDKSIPKALMDVLKTVVFAVFYKLPKEKRASTTEPPPQQGQVPPPVV